MATYLFPVKIKGAKVAESVPLTSFKLRETDGRDEELAANTAAAKGGSYTPREEQVRLALVEVNGEPVQQPYLAYDGWNTKARGLVLRAFVKINVADEREVEDFLNGVEDCEP